MLDDTPRKLLRIMYHFSRRYSRMPGLAELQRLSGRARLAVLHALSELEHSGYIAWEPGQPVEKAHIIRMAEQPGPVSRSKGSGHWLD